MRRRGRVLLMVEPRLFEASLAAELARSAPLEVVQHHEADPVELAGAYDAAVVTIELPDEVRPAVVITLPENDHPNQPSRLTIGQETQQVDLRCLADVSALLHEHLPGDRERDGGSRLASA